MENIIHGSGMAQMGLLVKELLQGRDIAKHLQSILLKDEYPSSSSNGTFELMIQKIIDSFESSIGILKLDSFHQQSQHTTVGTTDSPYSFSGSPKSHDSNGDLKYPNSKGKHGKRNILPVERKKLPGSTGTGLEGPVEDGFNWRKYGQKDILEAKYPRSYYRCTFRQLQGCFATKQVQRNDDDPTMFDVTYRGKHTCSQAASSSSSSSSSSLVNPTNIKPEPIETLTDHPPVHHQQSHANSFIWSFKTDHKDIKPIVTNNSSSNPFVYDNNFINHGSFYTDYINTYQQSYTNHIGVRQHVQYPHGDSVIETAVHASDPAMAPEFLFDPAEFEHHDILFDSPKLF